MTIQNTGLLLCVAFLPSIKRSKGGQDADTDNDMQDAARSPDQAQPSCMVQNRVNEAEARKDTKQEVDRSAPSPSKARRTGEGPTIIDLTIPDKVDFGYAEQRLNNKRYIGLDWTTLS